MFWRIKSPLNADDEQWQIECWRWLLKSFDGIDIFRQAKLILPTSEFFPPTDFVGYDKAEFIFDLVAKHIGVPADQFCWCPKTKPLIQFSTTS